ncbi:MAG: HAMP domain-containing histidine kinase [Chloroflexi bacterium]|nr:HAMP domain-containing histidine kinase [Chloroflexota bacterium]
MRVKRLRTLRVLLIQSFLLVVVISMTIIGFVAMNAPIFRAGAASIVQMQHPFRMQQLAPLLADHYELEGDWNSIESALAGFVSPDADGPFFFRPLGITGGLAVSQPVVDERLILLDQAGELVIDTHSTALSAEELAAMRENAWPIWVGGEQVGAFLIDISLMPATLEASRRLVLNSLLLAALLATITSAVVSVILANRLSGPLRRLNEAARTFSSRGEPELIVVEGSQEIAELSQTFNDMAQALAHQQKLREQMIADIAHELRTPLSIIKLEVEAMADGLQSPDKAVVALQTQTDALTLLIQDLRELSLVDAGGMMLQRHEVDLEELLSTVVDTWCISAAQKAIDLRLSIPAPLPTMRVDPLRIEQVLNNLLSNAVRYTPNDGRILVGAQVWGHEVVIAVADNGPGIPPELQDHLFDRFFRAESSRNRESGGSGLGLAIAQRLVHLHGGRIWVESEEGVGTTFYVALRRSGFPQPHDGSLRLAAVDAQ